MLTCLPQSLCSWNYRVLGDSSADLSYDYFTEQGTITLLGIEYSVRKHGWLSGHWTLERNGEVIADARKPNAMFRTFELRMGQHDFTLKARSAFARDFELCNAGRIIGVIEPVHGFTRRATIECSSLPELAQLFAFWLVALTWRRSAESSQAGAG